MTENGSFDAELHEAARELMLEGDPDVVACAWCGADATPPRDLDEEPLCDRCACDRAHDRDQQRICDDVRGA